MHAISRHRAGCILATAVSLLCLCVPAQATWSIVIVDRESKEVAIGSATCLLNFDLERGLPVVLVNRGAAAAQSQIDSTGVNRARIRQELLNGTPPSQILQLLRASDGSHESRQYGIVDTLGRSATFTGRFCGAYASGRTGSIGTLDYSIQGNVITGSPVIERAEQAILNTPGGIPEKLMAAMEAARAMGGDGRCSCSQTNPPGCGSPPPSFLKSAHVGFMIVARRGDTDGGCSASVGCAAGSYILNLNYIGRFVGDPDPVLRLRLMFDQWRAARLDVPDQVVSRVMIDPPLLPADGTSAALLHIEVLDFRGMPATGITGVVVEHDPWGSAGSAAIGPVVPLGDGVYEATLTAGAISGLDRIAVRVQTATSDRYLIPSGRLLVQPFGDLNGDGVVDNGDIDAFVLALTDPAGYAAAYPNVQFAIVGDMNRDGAFDTADIDGFVQALLR